MTERKSEAGFTIVELLVGIFILAIILSLAGTALSTATGAFRETRRVDDQSTTGRLALATILRQVRGAKNIVQWAGGPNGRLELVAADGSAVVFGLNGTSLYRSATAGATTGDTLANGIASFDVSGLKVDRTTRVLAVTGTAPTVFRITVTLVTPAGKTAKTFTEDATFR